MNEEHIIAAILTAGLVSKSPDDLEPKDVVNAYQLTLAELLASIRPTKNTVLND